MVSATVGGVSPALVVARRQPIPLDGEEHYLRNITYVMKKLCDKDKTQRELIPCPTRNLLLTETQLLSDRLHALSVRMMKLVPRHPEHLERLKEEARTIRERVITAREELETHYAAHGCRR
jgi:hypothetical protein